MTEIAIFVYEMVVVIKGQLEYKGQLYQICILFVLGLNP